MPYKELKRRILACDQENLTASILEQLIKNMPNADQMNQLAALKDQYDELAEPEQFAIVVGVSLSMCERLRRNCGCLACRGGNCLWVGRYLRV